MTQRVQYQRAWPLLVSFLAVGTGVLVALDPRIAFLAAGAVVAAAWLDRSRALLFVFGLVCALGLIRRLFGGGRIENDPMLLAPSLLLVLALVGRAQTDDGSRLQRRDEVTIGLLTVILFGLGAVPFLSWAASEKTIPGLYTVGLFASACLAMATAMNYRLPDVRGKIVKMAPAATIGLATYGLIQFTVLPSWDRAWMVASGLRSIGAPLPGQVRVFGSLESPGPFAMILGALILILLHTAATTSLQTTTALALLLASAAFFTSGVRTGLLGLAVVVVLAAFKLRRIKVFVLAGIGTAALSFIAREAIRAAGSNSVVFSSP